MTDEQILKLAIEKALNNGWQSDCLPRYWMKFRNEKEYFNKDFAKAFWGTDKVSVVYFNGNWKPGKDLFAWVEAKVTAKQPAWRAHLQQMVLYENPLKYLEQFLKEEK